MKSMRELVQRARRAKQRLDDFDIPTTLKITETFISGERTLEVDFHAGAVGQVMLAEMMAERLEQERRDLEQAERQTSVLGHESPREA